MGKEWAVNQKFDKYLQTFNKFHRIVIRWKSGKELAFPDLMSRLITNDMKTVKQWDARKYPDNIELRDENGNPITYTIEYEDPTIGNPTDSYPILCNTSDNRVIRIRFFDKGLKEEITDVTDQFHRNNK